MFWGLLEGAYHVTAIHPPPDARTALKDITGGKVSRTECFKYFIAGGSLFLC
jgi:hypothetical protein